MGNFEDYYHTQSQNHEVEALVASPRHKFVRTACFHKWQYQILKNNTAIRLDIGKIKTLAEQ